MSEKVRKPNEKKPAVGGDTGGAGFTPMPEQQDAQVCHGPYAESLPVVGKTVGEVRRKFADRFGIPKDAQAVLDGVDVSDDTIITNKQILTFMKRAGEKGAGDTLVIEGNRVRAISPEGRKVAVPLGDLIAHLSNPKMDTAGCVLPDGVRSAKTRGQQVIWVHETPPQVKNFKLISPDSPYKYGTQATYRNVSLSLPYVVVFASFVPGSVLGNCECFFRTSPLESMDDELMYPAFLNCSKFPDNTKDSNPLSLICTQHVRVDGLKKIEDPQAQMHAGLSALLGCLFETGFSFSTEENEGENWFGASSEKIKEISTVEKWQKSSLEDGLFALDVPWLKSGYTVRKVIDRIFNQSGVRHIEIKDANDVAKILFGYKKGGKFEKA